MTSKRTFVVTGCNTGIGRVIATELAKLPGRVIMACRSAERTAPVCDAIRAETGNDAVEYWHLDMSSLASVRAFVQRVGNMPVHVLVNNAGVMQGKRKLTEDGYEESWQVNALSPFLLTRLLLPNLRTASKEAGGAPGSARVVYVGSMLDKQGDLSDLNTIPDFLSLQRFSCEAGFKSFDAYSTSKLAGTLLHLELANRLKADAASAGLAINVASPGMVNTELNRHLLPWPLPSLLWYPLSLVLRTPAQGAACAVALAADGAPNFTTTGRYFRDGSEIDRRDTLPLEDAALLSKLWSTAEDMFA